MNEFEKLFYSPEESAELQQRAIETLVPGGLPHLRLMMRKIAYADAARKERGNRNVAIHNSKKGKESCDGD